MKHLLFALLVVSISLAAAGAASAQGDPFAGTWNPIGGGRSVQLLPQGDGTYTLRAGKGPDRRCTRRGDTLECLWLFTADDWKVGSADVPRHVRSRVEGREMIGFILTLVENARYLSAEGQDVHFKWTDQAITSREVTRKRINTYVRAACPGLAELKQQLERDQTALRRQQASIERGNAELERWARENERAQAAALSVAVEGLRGALVAKVGEATENRLKEVETALKSRAVQSQAWQRRLEQIRALRSTNARLSGALDGVKTVELSETAGSAAQTYERLRDWARASEPDARLMDRLAGEIAADSELTSIMEDSGLSAVIGGASLVKSLGPWMTAASFAQFVVAYGYEAAAWTASRSRIVQQNLLRESELGAVDALKRQIEQTIQRIRECKSIVQ
jgi:hypothetical protein